ncbi:MAG: hypothetical protein Q9195_008566, partial [Heterodermia aff. obscurata]
MAPPASFAARRKARKVGQDEDDESGHTPNVDNEPTPTVIRPRLSKPKSLRTSITPGGTSMLDEDNDSNNVFTPKKSTLSRIAISQNAARKSSSLAPRQIDDEQRPSYTATALHELKSSTPSTPKDLTTLPAAAQTLDLIAAKFGTVDLALRTDTGLIPTPAEIAEKKARRKRLAQENEYLNLHSEEEDEEPNEDEKYGETRLVPDDEDIAEGFDEFVSDGRVALGRQAERDQRRKRKEDIAALIADASGSGSEDDGSEVERRQAYEAAQTRKGMEGLRHEGEEQQRRARTPPRITPLPGLGAV